MWNIILRKDYGEVVIQSFKTRRQAEEELKNRELLTQHLGARRDIIYSIKRGGVVKGNGRTLRNL